MKKYSGFTLLEILLYVVIGGITLVIAVFSFTQLNRLSTSFRVNNELNQTANSIISQIQNIVNEADTIISPKMGTSADDEIILRKDNLETTIKQESNNITVSYSNGDPSYNLNTTGILVVNTPANTLSFEQINAQNNTNNTSISQSIKLKFTLRYNKPALSSYEYEAEKAFETTISLSNQNQAFEPILNTYPYGPLAIGGDTVTDITVGNDIYRVHTFTTVGTSSLNVIQGGEFEYLVVAGGGGGGSDMGGGGGAGGVLEYTNVPVNAGTYNIVVGGGGEGYSDYGNRPRTGASGGNSSAFNNTAIGGGGGSSGHYYEYNEWAGIGPEASGGGSGGGGSAAYRNSGGRPGGAGTAGQGTAGGLGQWCSNNYYAGGGGGSEENSQVTRVCGSRPGVGGNGKISNILGTPFRFGAGGGGAGYTGAGQGDGGLGGGGGGARWSSGTPGSGGTGGINNGGGGGQGNSAGGGNGGANTGSGGGGGGHSSGKGGNGGSGIVIVRYKLATLSNGAAYGLRRLSGFKTNPNQLSSNYNERAIRIRRDRGLDQAEIDIGFNSKGELDQVALQNFVGYQNFLNYSEDITTTGGWSLNNITTIPDNTQAPDGTNAAEKVNLSAGNNNKSITKNTNIVSGSTYTESYYVKANNNYNFVQIAPDTGFSSTAFQNYNLSGNGSLGSSSGISAGQANIQSVGNGWYRISLTSTANSTVSGGMLLSIVSSASSGRLETINVETNTDSIFVWGAMRHLGSTLKPYQKTDINANTGDGYVTTWYDQSGNKNNAIQATIGAQPKIVDGVNGIIKANNRPVIQFDGNDQLVSSAFNSSTSSTAFFVASRAANNQSFMARSSNYATLSSTDLFNIYYLNKSNTAATVGADTKNSLNLYTAIRIPSLDSTLAIGAGSTGNFLNGNMAELIIYDGNRLSNKTAIENNLRDYYGTP